MPPKGKWSMWFSCDWMTPTTILIPLGYRTFVSRRRGLRRFLRLADSDSLPRNDHYLLAAVRNACLNRIRQMSLHGRVKALMPIDDGVDLQPIDKREERLDGIAAFVEEQLEEPHRSIFHLRFDEDLTVGAIARRLGLNANTTYKYLSQSIQRIRHHLEKTAKRPRL